MSESEIASTSKPFVTVNTKKRYHLVGVAKRSGGH